MTPTDVLEYWFGSADLAAEPPPSRRAIWFASDPRIDQDLRERFGALLDAPEQMDNWTSTDDGLTAAIVVLDQMSRNIHRGTARAFAGDARARALAEIAIARGVDRSASLYVRSFLYMPFEHAEDRAAQERAVELFTALARDLPDRASETTFLLDYARRHRDIVARFGRFPGRNAALVRPDTAEEAAWLASGGETFGQRTS